MLSSSRKRGVDGNVGHIEISKNLSDCPCGWSTSFGWTKIGVVGVECSLAGSYLSASEQTVCDSEDWVDAGPVDDEDAAGD